MFFGNVQVEEGQLKKFLMEHKNFKSIREFSGMTFIDLHTTELMEGWHERKGDRIAVRTDCEKAWWHST